MTTLLISLPLTGSDPGTAYDHVLSADGLTATTHASAPLALLPQGADEVVALVPALALSWHQVKLPEGSVPRAFGGERASLRLRSILDGLLEDQLLDDPAQLHFALQPQATSSALVWVAVCDKIWLQSALTALASAGFAAKRIVPEFTPDGLQDTLVVVGDADRPCVVGLRSMATAADAAPAQANGLLVGDLNTVSAQWFQNSLSEHAQVLAEPAVAAVAESVFKRPVVLVPHAERLLQAAQSPWDMAQFDLAHAERERRWAKVTLALSSFWRAPQWRVARLAVVVGVVANLIGLNAFALREQALLSAKRQAVRAVLTDTFPKIPVVVDAPIQMAREVAALQRANGVTKGDDLESMLESFSSAAPDKYVLSAIEYAANELRIKGSPVADAADFVDKVNAAGLQASQQGEQWLISAGKQP
jgi:general secretion pathway protein L